MAVDHLNNNNPMNDTEITANRFPSTHSQSMEYLQHFPSSDKHIDFAIQDARMLNCVAADADDDDITNA